MTKPKVLGAAIGQCVHVAGLDHFLRICEDHGWQAVSLGPAVPVNVLMDAVRRETPQLVAVSYRLTAEDARPLFAAIIEASAAMLEPRPRWVFGGTPPAAHLARETGFFERAFDGTDPPEAVAAYISGEQLGGAAKDFPSDLVSRIAATHPMPLIRHHYGEPDLARTIVGARRIAEAGVLDVLSIGPDQNAQEHFFRPEEMDPRQDGAGGVPLRKPEDLAAIYEASRCGNFPLVRCYSGTRDLIPWAEMSVATIHNAWGAIPLCWYSAMDGRSKTPFPDAIREKLSAVRWYAEHGIPVEMNESHQWSLRDAHDSLAVAMAFLSAYNAKHQGVKRYVIQMMHNTPPSTSPAMDMAKMLAKLEMIRDIECEEFTTYREVRAGITSLPTDPHEAKGHMAASAIYSMALKPHILHVVGYSEARNVVDPDTLTESCKIARGAVKLALQGAPDPTVDPKVEARKKHLVSEAGILLKAIWSLGPDKPDPWTDPEVITAAIREGILDTPHFRGHPDLYGRIVTKMVDGGWEAIDPATRRPLSERERLNALGVGV